jgi:hypothetical protein
VSHVCLDLSVTQLFDEKGNTLHEKIKWMFDPQKHEMPTFNERVMDFNETEYDPREDPRFIAYAASNGGKYPPEFAALFDRFVEDTERIGGKKYKYWKKMRYFSQTMSGVRDRILKQA